MTNIQFLYLHNAKCYDSHVIICGNVIHNKLRDIIYLEKILKSYNKNFKEKLGPLDRIKHEPVKLKIDKTRGIRPVKNTKAYDIPLHLREAAKDEFNEMIAAGIIVEAEPEATGWASLAFPRRKPNSSPIKCRWVTDFRDLNRALDRPVWGGESSGQLLRHLDPSAKFFAVFDAM